MENLNRLEPGESEGAAGKQLSVRVTSNLRGRMLARMRAGGFSTDAEYVRHLIRVDAERSETVEEVSS